MDSKRWMNGWWVGGWIDGQVDVWMDYGWIAVTGGTQDKNRTQRKDVKHTPSYPHNSVVSALKLVINVQMFTFLMWVLLLSIMLNPHYHGFLTTVLWQRVSSLYWQFLQELVFLVLYLYERSPESHWKFSYTVFCTMKLSLVWINKWGTEFEIVRSKDKTDLHGLSLQYIA